MSKEKKIPVQFIILTNQQAIKFINFEFVKRFIFGIRVTKRLFFRKTPLNRILNCCALFFQVKTERAKSVRKDENVCRIGKHSTVKQEGRQRCTVRILIYFYLQINY